MLSQLNQLEQSIQTKELIKLVEWYINSIKKTIHDQQAQLSEDRQIIHESKIAFLNSLVSHIDDTYSQCVDIRCFYDLLFQYKRESQKICLQILETTFLTYDTFQENRPYIFNTSIILQQWFIKFKLEDIDILDYVLHSKLLKQYISLLRNQRQEFDLNQIQKNCVRYFQDKQIVRIVSENNAREHILGFVLQDNNLAISDMYKKYPKIEILILVHLYFCQLCGQLGIVYQRSFSKGILSFESEIFPIQFNKQWLTQDMIKFLSTIDHWKPNVVNQMPEGPIWQESINPVHAIMNHNYLLKQTIQEIDTCLCDIAEQDDNYLLAKYQIQGQEPTLCAQYTNLQYYQTLQGFIRIAINNPDRLDQLKKYQTKQNRRITKIFYYLINCTSFSQVSLIQQLFLWMFQYKFCNPVLDCGNMCNDVISKGTQQVILCKKLQKYLQKIVNSQGVQEVVTRINSIEGRYSDQSDLIIEYAELRKFFETTPLIIFEVTNLLGISLINGRIGVSRKLVESKKIEDRAMLLITLVHEAYCHKKRKDYVSPGNVLTLTPEKLNAREFINQIPKIQKGEGGYYFEDQIFGKVINSLSRSQAYYILFEYNWLKSQDDFKREFKALPGVEEELNMKRQDNSGSHQKSNMQRNEQGIWFKCSPIWQFNQN